MFLSDDDANDFNYNENRTDDIQYEDDEDEDIELNKTFNNTHWYKEYGP